MNLRSNALEIFNTALAAAEPRRAVQSAIALGSRIRIFDVEFSRAKPIYVIAMGKAAAAMAAGAADVLGKNLTSGVIAGPIPPGLAFAPASWQAFAGGHPLPNQKSLDAARAALELIDRAVKEKGQLLFLVSGGGSAMMELPRLSTVSLDDLREAYQQLVHCGASIAEINSVRRTLSAIKGGGLANRAGQAKRITLIVSDTNSGDEASVASGPTLPAPATAPAAPDVIARYQLQKTLPPSILPLLRLEAPKVSTASPLAYVLLDNQMAISAAANKARALGFATEVASEICEQPVMGGATLLVSRLLHSSSEAQKQPVCVLSGGEFSCPVRGDGIGGRNLETVLRCTLALERALCGQGPDGRVVMLSAGTDGLDGNSPAAGGLADEQTLLRAHARGLNPAAFLDRSDSYQFFAKLDDAILTGPTGTNVRDVRVLLRRGTNH